ncbi:MAG: helicase-related protein [Aquificaceae bacterium]
MLIGSHGELNLGETIRNHILTSDELKFLTAFFYFSALDELYSALEERQKGGNIPEGFMKVLVGLNVDSDMYDLYEHSKRKYSEKDFLESLQKAFTSEEMDNEETYRQVEFFIKLLQERKLILRKTREPNHAKLYIFKKNQLSYPVFIIGSSNLTKAGLSHQNELNIEIALKEYSVKVEEYFDRLWEDSIEITAEHIISTLKEKTFLRDITPFQAWLYLLKLYLELHSSFEKTEWEKAEEVLKRAGYDPYKYQLEAVLQGVRSLKDHGGVLLADVVGLGKSVIACGIARMLKEEGIASKGLVICPPHLMGDEKASWGWEKYLNDFGLEGWKVRSLGKLEEVLEFVKRNKDIKAIIVDEAHRFRNEDTKRYHLLREICRGKYVMLLTATPFNNKPSDIYALLKLFTVPKQSTLILGGDLEKEFNNYNKKFEELKKKKRQEGADLKEIDAELRAIAKKIRGIIEPITIRRNRLDLKYYKENIPMPEVKDPEPCFYELTEDQSKFYDKVIEFFKDCFKGAIYHPVDYLRQKEVDEFERLSQENLYNFMKKLLVKRFESSISAFYESVKRFKELNESALRMIEKYKVFILDRDLMEVLEDEEEFKEALEEYYKKLENPEETIKKKKYQLIYQMSELNEEFEKDIKSDKEFFEELEKEIENLGFLEKDQKLEKLVEKIKEFKDNRKIVIFSEYVDTAKWLKERLSKEFPGKVLAAIGNLAKETVEEINKNFNAEYEDEGRYQILIATDKLSEGFNLHRAGVVVNYDIPWNPVRVIQRVGRINRIGKKVYDEIYILNFFPTQKGENASRQREIAMHKLFMIHEILGEDAKIFSEDEEPRPSELFKKELFERLNTYTEDQEESFYTKLRKEWEELSQRYKDQIEALKDLPTRLKTAKPFERDELIVVVKSGSDLYVLRHDGKAAKKVSFEEVYESIKAQENTPKLSLSKDFWQRYKEALGKLKEVKAATSGNKYYNLLSHILKKPFLTEEEKAFLRKLRDDVKDYGTLSKYVLKRILEWEKLDDEKLRKGIKELMKELGENFIESAQEISKEREKSAIITIENRKEATKHE